MNRQHREFTSTMRLGGNAAAVFPLLCPVREYEWIETWDCEVIHTVSGFAEQDCVFTTRQPKDGPLDTWVVSRYEPGCAIEFIRHNPYRVMRYSITCTADEGGTSSWRWTQHVTAINDEGDTVVRAMQQEEFVKQIAALETMLNHYLTNGSMLRTPPG